MTIDILDKAHEPTAEELADSIAGAGGASWRELTAFLAGNLGAKAQIAYSVCSGQPGWNLKYKKGGKALCTLYPEKDYFTALVVLGQEDRALFDTVREDYGSYITGLYDKCRLFNGTKWLMIEVTDAQSLAEVENLIALKLRK